ncbi:MAG: hypothetical protein OXM57_14510 [bacterium]|nr:hypothetical protein [bacterium]MDE0353890.1 hypothetical protein [bacterium]
MPRLLPQSLRLLGPSSCGLAPTAPQAIRHRCHHDPEQPPDHYQIDIYRAGDLYVIVGTSADPQQNMFHNIGRVAISRANIVGAIRTVVGDLSVDAAVLRVLVQDVFGSLDPEPST